METDPRQVRCTLDASPCPGEACPLWDVAAGACAPHGVERELLANQAVAAHLLELRRALETVSAAQAEEEHLQFFRRLNLENVHPGGTS